MNLFWVLVACGKVEGKAGRRVVVVRKGSCGEGVMRTVTAYTAMCG